ncbi:MAG: TIGR03557 family F420-dependent LLM class oxidoreductase [Dehalococcoidia bacterium]|nr:TIGR03557 family F420-dependent LLM class oxidoreductase [Dehalococcoidia bacterium]
MVAIGYMLASEEHSAPELATNAQRAEEAGFTFALVSDHFHPWVHAQGESPFVWATLGAIAQTTETIAIGTGVTCPLIRTHPAIIAQAAATTATLMPGRFFLGLGTGENLNEHITGEKWPPIQQRQEMLEEAIEVIRMLWQGGRHSHEGAYYSVEDARLYSLPEEMPPILVGASGQKSAALAGRAGDGLISTAPNPETVQSFTGAGGNGPRIGLFHTCWAESEEAGRDLLQRQWPNSGLGGMLGQDLRLPRDFEAATEPLTAEEVSRHVPCGPDPAPYLEQIRQFAEAGFDHVYIHNVGREQEGFFRFFEAEVLPGLRADVEPARITPQAA